MEEREASRRRFPAELSGGRRVSGEACQQRREILKARSRPPPAGCSRRRTRVRPAAGGAPGARSKAGRSRPVGELPRRAPARRRPAGRLRLPRPRPSPAPHTRGRQVPKRGFPKGCPPKSHPQIRRGCRRAPVGCRRAAASQARGRGQSRESGRLHKRTLAKTPAHTSSCSQKHEHANNVACGSGASHVVKYGAAAKTCLTRCCNLLSQCCTTAQIPVLPCLRPRSPFPIGPRSRSTPVLDPASDPGTASSSSRPPGPSLRRRSALDLIGRPPSWAAIPEADPAGGWVGPAGVSASGGGRRRGPRLPRTGCTRIAPAPASSYLPHASQSRSRPRACSRAPRRPCTISLLPHFPA
jgi:hypothetical protein